MNSKQQAYYDRFIKPSIVAAIDNNETQYQSFDCCMDNSSFVVVGSYNPDWYKRDFNPVYYPSSYIYEGNDYSYKAF